jgi:hypothetical protein
MLLGLTTPLTEMSTTNLPRGKGRPSCKTDNLTAIYEPIVYTMLRPRRLTNPWLSMACYWEELNNLKNFTWSEFLSIDPEVLVRFPALADILRSSGSGTGATQPREYN